MARHIHIHVHAPGLHIPRLHIPTRDADRTPFEELVELLMERVAFHNGKTQDDAEVGHPFYGNQYTTGQASAKPETVTSKGAKNQLHELLSSGHAFTLEELVQITGAKTPVTLTTALADLKNPKYAHKSGVLNILKDKNTGHYYVAKEDGKPAVPTPTAEVPKGIEPKTLAQPLEPAAEAPKVEAEPTPAAYTPPAISVPEVKMSKEMADGAYANAVEDLTNHAVEVYQNHGLTEAAKAWKVGKAQAMAQWATNFHGTAHKPATVEVFKEDKDLVEKLVNLSQDETISGASYLQEKKKALEEWKQATAKAKQESVKKAQQAPTPAPKAEPKAEPKASPATSAPAAPAVTSGDKEAFKPVPSSIVPQGHKHIGEDDFDGPAGKGEYSKGIDSLHNTMSADSKGAVANKIKIATSLDTALKESPHFEEVSAAYKKVGTGEYAGSLSARLIANWAGSSGGNNPGSCSLQLCVRDLFGMKDEHVSFDALKALTKHGSGTAAEDKLHKQAASLIGYDASTPEKLETYKRAMRDFAAAQYHNTQAYFKEKGVTHLHLVRGMGLGQSGESMQGARKVGVKLQPASSFSVNHDTAQSFGGSGGSNFVVKVPTSQVLGSYLTGYGCTEEHEVVVLAHHDLEAVQVGKSHASSQTYMVDHIKKHLGSPNAFKPTVGGEASAPHKASAPAPAKTVTKTTKPTYAEHGYTTPTTKAKKAKDLGEAGDLEGLKEHLAALAPYPQAHGFTQQWINHLEANPKKLAQKQQKAAITTGAKPELSHFGLKFSSPQHITEAPKKAMALADAEDLEGLKAHLSKLQTMKAPKTTKYVQAMIKYLGG